VSSRRSLRGEAAAALGDQVDGWIGDDDLHD